MREIKRDLIVRRDDENKATVVAKDTKRRNRVNGRKIMELYVLHDDGTYACFTVEKDTGTWKIFQ